MLFDTKTLKILCLNIFKYYGLMWFKDSRMKGWMVLGKLKYNNICKISCA